MTVRYAKCNAGFSMMEVLVSALVLSIGLLGLAGLHVTSIRSSHSSFYRSQATLLAYEIADRMRANPLQARALAYNISSIAGESISGDGQAAADLADWKSNLGDALPASFDGRINCQADGDCLVEVQWDDSRPERKIADEEEIEEPEGTQTAAADPGGDVVAQTPTTRWDDSTQRKFQMRTRI